MLHTPIGLAELVKPLNPYEFLSTVQGQVHHHFIGEEHRFDEMFSFAEMNRLLGMWHLWSDRSIKIVLDGRTLPAEEYCVTGADRTGRVSNLLSARKLEPLLEYGATMVLDRMESLSSGVRALSNALQSACGGIAQCNAYCSFHAHAGFPSHFDMTEVFVLQIAGSKRWRIYEGRGEEPAAQPGQDYSSLSHEHHENAKGAVLAEVHMTPGDVLYIPCGQYHDALTVSEASLHLTFGISRATAQDFMGVLIESLGHDVLLRRDLAHFDDRAAIAEQLREIAAHLMSAMTDSELPAQVAQWQREKIFRDMASPIQLPERVPQTRVRVRRGADVEWDGHTLRVTGAVSVLQPGDAAVISWILDRELFLASELLSVFGFDQSTAELTLERLNNAGLIEPV